MKYPILAASVGYKPDDILNEFPRLMEFKTNTCTLATAVGEHEFLEIDIPDLAELERLIDTVGDVIIYDEYYLTNKRTIHIYDAFIER